MIQLLKKDTTPKSSRLQNVLVLTREDIDSSNPEAVSRGFEVLIAPMKYRSNRNDFLEKMKLEVLARHGQVIWI